LAFSIETRLGALQEIVRHVDENLNELGREIERAANLDSYIQGGYAFSFENETALRRVLIGANSFITESRSCFENLAAFYREFLRHYFGQEISRPDSYAKLTQLARDPKWATDLRAFRHEVVHDRAPWLAFEVRPGTSPKYEPILVLNWRPGPLLRDDYLTFESLRRIRLGLSEAMVGLRTELIRRVISA
jgi:hypothetical protein